MSRSGQVACGSQCWRLLGMRRFYPTWPSLTKGRKRWLYIKGTARGFKRLPVRGYVEKRTSGLLKQTLNVIEKRKNHNPEKQHDSYLLGEFPLSFGKRTAQDRFTGKEEKMAAVQDGNGQ